MKIRKVDGVKAKVVVTVGDDDGESTIILYRGGKTGLAFRPPANRILKDAARSSRTVDATHADASVSAALPHQPRRGSMNTDQFKGKWEQFKGEVKKQWGKFTDDDLMQIEGDYDKFVGRVQERYGDKKDEIVRWADDWYRRQGQPSPPQREAQRPR